MNENKAKFAVVMTAFHGGGIASLHTSLKEAIKSARKNTSSGCVCGCAEVFPVNKEAAEELHQHYEAKARAEGRFLGEVVPKIHLDQDYEWSPTLLSDLSDCLTGNELPYSFVR